MCGGSSPLRRTLRYVLIGLLAQLAEQGTLNPKVIGSIPIQPTNRVNNIVVYLSDVDYKQIQAKRRYGQDVCYCRDRGKAVSG